LACVRQGLPSSHAKGADNLPQEQEERILAGLIGHLDVEELERAFAAVYSASPWNWPCPRPISPSTSNRSSTR
jgi:hypothetical protein